MHINFMIILVTALVPMILGFIWYNPKVLGTVWMNAAGITEDKMKGANMALIFGLSFFLSFLLAMSVQFMVIHQYSMYSILANEPGITDPTSEVSLMIRDFMAKYGTNFRTFKHGALHGTLAGFMIALPILGTNAMFERKGFKYIAVNCGYWIVCLALMGGIICAFS
ncbi:MAG: DUF1761 domain-containing protein [Bacteroidetes bacterium]|nr:DUF1761 domain-containing protein [Bacteroidota bacterium]